MGKEAKTNAMRILERAKVAYTAHEYPHEEGVAVDGVTPSNDTIASESYPLCNEFYAVLHADAAADSPERQLYDWLDTAAGQDCIKKSGYVAVAPTTAANSAV